jgi:hypothetical protein
LAAGGVDEHAGDLDRAAGRRDRALVGEGEQVELGRGERREDLAEGVLALWRVEPQVTQLADPPLQLDTEVGDAALAPGGNRRQLLPLGRQLSLPASWSLLTSQPLSQPRASERRSGTSG